MSVFVIMCCTVKLRVFDWQKYPNTEWQIKINFVKLRLIRTFAATNIVVAMVRCVCPSVCLSVRMTCSPSQTSMIGVVKKQGYSDIYLFCYISFLIPCACYVSVLSTYVWSVNVCALARYRRNTFLEVINHPLYINAAPPGQYRA